jgi:hypothetical protein
MDQQSLFFPILVVIIATVLMLMAIQFLAKKQNLKSQSDNKINTSFTIWITAFLASFFLLLKIAVEKTENAIEVIIFSKTINDTFFQVMQRIAIYTGFTFFFTFATYYIVHSILKYTMGNRKDSIEMGNNNIGYFIIKGAIQILLTITMLTLFDHFLNWFAPVVDTPFYH